MEQNIPNKNFVLTVIDENGNRTKRVMKHDISQKARFTVTIKPASAAEKRLAIATRAIRQRKMGQLDNAT